MELSVVNAEGKKASALTVSDSAFGARFNEALVHQVVTAYQAGARRGTRAQKNRAAVSGGSSKPWRQKGTGRARAGTIRSPLWRGGGKIFPASTQDFSQKVNRKMYRAAIRAIVSELARQERLIVCDDLTVDAPKTRELVDRLGKLGVTNVLIVNHQPDNNLALSARNLVHVDVVAPGELDPVSLIRHEHVVMTSASVKQVESWLQ